MAFSINLILILSSLILLQILNVQPEEYPSSNVIVLTDENFDQEIVSIENILVMFQAPWCSHCKRLLPEFEKAANLLRDTPKVALAMIDCMADGRKTCDKFLISGYPTVNAFTGGILLERYDGLKEAATITEYVKRMAGLGQRMEI